MIVKQKSVATIATEYLLVSLSLMRLHCVREMRKYKVILMKLMYILVLSYTL